MAYRVLVSDKLSERGLDVFKQHEDVELDYRPGLSPEALREAIVGADALVIRSATQADAALLEAADRLKVIGRAGIGVDNVDVAAASKRGIMVMNTPHGNAVTAAEHAISLLCALARHIPQATASMRAGRWEKSKFQGRELSEKVLGMVGLGNIGRIVCQRAQGLRMRVIASDPVLSPEAAAKLGIELVDFSTLLERSDFITIHAPLVAGTKHLFNDAAFERVKKGALIVNAARGGIIEEAALARALESGAIAGAALDVFEQEPPAADHPLLAHDRVICTPHLGASTAEAQERVAVEIAEQIYAFLSQGSVKNALNMPSISAQAGPDFPAQQRLARRLGSLLAQLGQRSPSSFRVVCRGESISANTRPLAYEALAGFLSVHTGTTVNAVRAPFEAEARGIELLEVADAKPHRFTTSIQVELSSAEAPSACASGTLGHDGEPRLTRLDGFNLDALLDGELLVLRNVDQPGVIGAVGTVLGTAGTNVSRMQVGMHRGTEDAIAFWNVDATVDSEMQAALRALPHVDSVYAVSLGD